MNRIWYPIPVQCLSQEQALEEHFDIYKLQADIIEGRHNDLISRWKPYPLALYDRFSKGRAYILGQNPNWDLDDYPTDLSNVVLLLSSTLVYPSIPDHEVLEMWNVILNS